MFSSAYTAPIDEVNKIVQGRLYPLVTRAGREDARWETTHSGIWPEAPGVFSLLAKVQQLQTHGSLAPMQGGATVRQDEGPGLNLNKFQFGFRFFSGKAKRRTRS
jgi:hypothetical protein